eukprot:s2081_g1.t1
MDVAALADVNSALSEVVVSKDYSLQVSLAGDVCHVLGRSGESLQLAAGQAPSPARTSLRIDSMQTVQRLASGGRAAALPLLAAGKLKVEGDLSQLEELRKELSPHAARLQPLAEALLSNGTPGEVIWVPDEAADCCMAETCGRPFTLFRRRHHCRSCGKIFCNDCAPLRGAPQPKRSCTRCWEKRSRPLPAAAPAPPLPVAAPPGPSSTPEVGGKDSTDLLVEVHVEDTLNSIRLWWRLLNIIAVVLAAISFALIATKERLVVLLPLLACILFFRRWLWRYAEVWWTCVVLFGRVFSARCRAAGRPTPASEAIWALCHKVCARFLFDSVVSLGGFWVKLAQTASVLSMLPDAYVAELSKLQDAMPADDLTDVEALLAQEFGRDWRDKVLLSEDPVLGSATIAQVHKATFRRRMPDGTIQEVPGVIKVQHRHVEEKLLVDISASVLVARLVTALMPHFFSDLRTTIQDTAQMSRAELDFRLEAKNQQEARERVLAAGIDVIIPEVFPEFVTRRALGMEFIRGTKITDYALAEASIAQRQDIMTKLIDFYGYTLHGPIFNCDPHPGNILVEKDTGRLCVLDWGQVRHLAQHERFAYAKLFMAALMEDVHLFVEGCEALGFAMSDLDGPPDATAIAMIGALRFLLRDSRPIAQSRADFEQLEQVFGKLSGETKAIQKGGEQIVKGPLMPLTKTVSLLFEVSSRLDVSLPLMHIFVCHGYPMLLKERGFGTAQVQPMATSFRLKLSTGPNPGRGPWSSTLARQLGELHAEGLLLGAQLCVLDLAKGDVLADVALGHTSWLSPTEVTASTPFNLLEISKLFLAFCVLRLVEQGKLSYHTVLCESSEGKVTLEHALSHTSGYLKLVPSGDITFRDFCDAQRFADKVVAEPPMLPPGIRQQYHHVSYGALLLRAIRLAKCDPEVLWEDFAREAAASKEALRLRCPGASCAAEKQMRSPSLEDFGKRMEEFEHFIDTTNRGKCRGATRSEKADAALWLSFLGREHWFNPVALSRPRARESIQPGLQAFATAKDAARALRAACAGEVLKAGTWQEAIRSRKPTASGPDSQPSRLPHKIQQFQDAEWGCGVQLLKLPGGHCGQGHVASNGSFALRLATPRPVVAVFLVNRSDGATAATRVLETLVELCKS